MITLTTIRIIAIAIEVGLLYFLYRLIRKEIGRKDVQE